MLQKILPFFETSNVLFGEIDFLKKSLKYSLHKAQYLMLNQFNIFDYSIW
jgi:hypothetical protein